MAIKESACVYSQQTHLYNLWYILSQNALTYWSNLDGDVATPEIICFHISLTCFTEHVLPKEGNKTCALNRHNECCWKRNNGKSPK